MSDFKADLHCHSTCSDGTLTPSQLVLHAKEKGLSGLAITDHDTIDSYPLAFQTAQKENIKLITGAEFSAYFKNHSVHILCYAYPPESPILKTFSARHEQRRQNRNQAILDLLVFNEMPLNKEEIIKYSPHAQGAFGRVHIARAMVQKGYVKDINEAFRLYLAENMPCYNPGELFTVEETLETIHRAGGLAFIAHPHLIKSNRLIKKLLDLPFDGLEAYYARFPTSENAKWIKMAETKKWMISGGSDFHGEVKPDTPLGASWVGEEIFMLLETHQKNSSV
jgi:predicted metal-dependent phosphoesterase TrpH